MNLKTLSDDKQWVKLTAAKARKHIEDLMAGKPVEPDHAANLATGEVYRIEAVTKKDAKSTKPAKDADTVSEDPSAA